MENFSELLAHARLAVSDKLAQLYSQIEHHVPDHIEDSVKLYIQAISGTTKQSLVSDLRDFKATPTTVTLALVAASTLIFAGTYVSSASGTPKSTKSKSKSKKKKQLKALKANNEIQRILDFVAETYVPQIDAYIESYPDLSEEDRQYKYKYFEEMLLKELMALDDVDVNGNDVLRNNRKKVIRFIQDHQKRLDVFKNEN